MGLLAAFSVAVFVDTASVYLFIEAASLWVRQVFGRFYLWLGLGCVVFVLAVAFSPYGKQRLGKAALPQYNLWSWTAMLYSAGMGAGILLRAVQEPVFMQQHQPLFIGTTAEVVALEYTFYQWGFTAWAFYGLFALVVGYYFFEKEKPILISSTIENQLPYRPALGLVNVLTILTTVFGLTAAIGLGTTQIGGGLHHLYDVTPNLTVTLLLTLLICVLAFVSVWSGIDKGISLISKANMAVALLLLLFVFVQSDIVAVFSLFFVAFWHYIIDFVPMSLALGSYNPGEAFLTDWTYYYWAFWLAWAPFTGIFIARISEGRTIREVLIGVLLLPSLGTFFWFAVFGSSAFGIVSNNLPYDDRFGDVFSSVFVFMEAFPLSYLTNIIIVLLLVSFLVTSVDSAVFVLSMFSDRGKREPARRYRLMWSVVMAIASAALLLLGAARPEMNVLTALQKILIITSLPFAFLVVLMAFFFIKELVDDKQ